MSAFDGEENKREIIIVRRGGGDHEEGHHGGVWKIAFADFMTAMMCFFLVMWLVNAANEESKAAIASYFNPMTLVDQMPSNEGGEQSNPAESPEVQVETSPVTPVEEMDKKSGPGEFANSVDSAESQETSDAHLFSDPYAVLAEIAAETAMLQNISSKGDGGAQTSGPATGAEGGESYRDPFAPDFWSHEVADTHDAELNVFREPQEEEVTPPPAAEINEATDAEDAIEAALPVEPAELAEGVEAAADAAPAEDAEGGPSQQTEQLAEQIREEIVDAFGANSDLNQAISVTARAEGVLISVTDELNYGMFQVGSAIPRGELVLAMEKIGRTLNEHSGRVRINGHTDGRPFKSGDYDNWRLSTARAHSAYYMLVRAGLDEGRIKEVAGFADRELKITSDPFADANRRIEIFLEAEG